jgi:transcriptional regulator with XRE-family HTH domain
MSLSNEDIEVCERIKILFEKSGMTQSEFSNSIGMTQASLSNVMLQKTAPGSKFIQGILREFQNVNSRWLHLGEEPIFATPDQLLKSAPRERIQNNIIHRSTNAGISTGKGNQDVENQNITSGVIDALLKCQEENKNLQDRINLKNEEIITLNQEIIRILKQK